jgi:hydroxypyruvate reductase
LCTSIRHNAARAGTPVCVLSGGETIVRLVPTAEPRKGGRNQELVLAAAERLWNDGMPGIAILSGGTDGEDGPTDAAGAVVDATLLRKAKSLGLEPAPFLAINNAYPFFDQINALLKTGPTDTNVMDLRIAIVAPSHAHKESTAGAGRFRPRPTI